jgi:VanZ family protein
VTPGANDDVSRGIGRRLSLWAPVALYMILIFALSATPSPPDLPSGVSDKIAHAALYAGLGALLVRARAGGWRRPVTRAVAVTATLVAALYGISDELHQGYVPPRQMEVSDVLADSVGAGLASGVLYTWTLVADAKRRRSHVAEGRGRRGV